MSQTGKLEKFSDQQDPSGCLPRTSGIGGQTIEWLEVIARTYSSHEFSTRTACLTKRDTMKIVLTGGDIGAVRITLKNSV
jgi:hypothetical protein